MINDLLLNNWLKNGASLDGNLQPITKNDGFMCSLLGYEKTFNPCDIDNIKKTIIKYKNNLKAGQYVGIWQYNGLVYVDISKHYIKKENAIKNGIKNKQLAIYDLKNKKDIKLTKTIYLLYKYNKNKNDVDFITEYLNVKEMTDDLKKNYNTLKSYIIESIDAPLKELLHDKYLIIKENVLISDLID